MLRLSTFGGVRLTQDDAPVAGSATGRRRLALLVVLAAVGERGISRDALASLLWPDSETGQARHSLEQTIYATRQALRCDGLFLGPAVVRLNLAHITTDVHEFELAVASRQLERAVALYRGPFADGLPLDGSGELQRRIDAFRTGFAREYVEALEALARAAAARGEHTATVRWRRLLADAEPLSGRVAAGLVEALAAAGEPAQALHFALIHESLVRQELDVPPAPEITSWIRRLRGHHDVKDLPGTGKVPPDMAPAQRVVASSADSAADRDRQMLGRLSRAVGQRYRVGRLLADGSITATYAVATTESPPLELELHLVRASLAARTDSDRFSRVFERVRALADPHILPTLDYGTDEQLLFFIAARQPPLMLRDRIRRERQLPIVEAVRIARDITTALAHAHLHGVRHGDLRPKHVLLTPDSGMVRSFGVIDALGTDADQGARSTIVTLGSPTYLSPEQLVGDIAGDERSDVYALGCVLYEMLAGEPPFGRPSHVAVLGRKMTQSPPPLRTLRASVPVALERVVQTCLVPVPADRFSSGVEVLQALADVETMGGE